MDCPVLNEHSRVLLKRNSFLISLIIALIYSSTGTNAQEVKKLTFEEVIKLSEEQSPNALIAKHRFRASYWEYRSYQAQYLPSLTLTGITPDFSNGLTKVYDSGSDQYIYTSKNTISTMGTLSLSQNIGPTGTVIALSSDLTLYKDIALKLPVNYISDPAYIRITQPIRQYNTLKWQKKIEPVKYNAARKTYLSNIEGVHMNAVMNFFFSGPGSNKQADIGNELLQCRYSIQDSKG